MTRISRVFGVVMLVLLSQMFAQSCGGGGASEERGSCVPTNLQYRPQSNGVFFSWRPNCDKNTSIGGYNFYVVEKDKAPAGFPEGVSEPHNDTPYPGDTNPDRSVETAELKYLTNGRIYLGAVRIIFPNGKLSEPSNVVEFTAMPAGEIELAGRYKGDKDGFSFAGQTYVSADDGDNDLYFISKSGKDYLGSPDKLSFGLHKSEFRKVGNFPDAMQSFGHKAKNSPKSEIQIKPGDAIDIALTGGGVARVFVKSITGSGDGRRVTLEWFYNAQNGAL